MMKCEDCGRVLPKETKKVANPYIEEVGERIVMVYLCNDCYQDHVDDI